MAESICRVRDVEICFERFGDEADPALLLVMGLGAQMVWWREEFCRELAAQGFHVIRYDNRDVGRSSRVQGAPMPTAWQLVRRDMRTAAYTLADMARDAVGLLDHLRIERAHVVGASMGGMIAQILAAEHRRRVSSLVSIMSNTGSRRLGQPGLRMYPWLLTRVSEDREGYIEDSVRRLRRIGSPGFDIDDEAHRRLAALTFDRMHLPHATSRQLAAIMASGDRTPLLRTITAPTLVIHGTDDPLIPPSGGEATARAVPGARLMMIEGMGHDLPQAVWPRVVQGIIENTARAGGDVARERRAA